MCLRVGAAVRHRPTDAFHHLKKLRDAGIVDSERQGLWAYYYVTPGALQRAIRMAELSMKTSDHVAAAQTVVIELWNAAEIVAALLAAGAGGNSARLRPLARQRLREDTVRRAATARSDCPRDRRPSRIGRHPPCPASLQPRRFPSRAVV